MDTSDKLGILSLKYFTLSRLKSCPALSPNPTFCASKAAFI